MLDSKITPDQPTTLGNKQELNTDNFEHVKQTGHIFHDDTNKFAHCTHNSLRLYQLLQVYHKQTFTWQLIQLNRCFHYYINISG